MAARVALHGENRPARTQERGLQGHGTGPGPDVPDHVARTRGQAGQGHGPNRDLGEDPVRAGQGRLGQALEKAQAPAQAAGTGVQLRGNLIHVRQAAGTAEQARTNLSGQA